MASKPDYYEVLGVAKTAGKEEINAAYRREAMKYHPDRNPGDAEAVEKFKLAAEAFDVLHNDQKRAAYDQFGHAGLGGNGGNARFHDVNDIFSMFGDIFGDSIFGSFFGGGGRRGGNGQRMHQGADIRCNITLDLVEAARGVTKTIKFKRHETCTTCNGNGCRPGTQPQTCRYCGGSGRIQQSTGIFSIQTTCPQCRGRGQMITEPCRDCNGVGLVPQSVTRDVKIPAGIDSGTRLRLQGEGERSPDGGPPGDCYVFVSIKQHPLFQREGQDLICRVPIGYAQAALGAEIEVPTLDGKEKMKISRGTQNGDVITLRGKGMPLPRRNMAGDLHIVTIIEVPKKLTPEHEELLRKLAEIEHDNIMPERKSFFGSVKEYVTNFFSENGDVKENDPKK
ncbi:MAG: molecular chaperone DnaJ [Planctomycetaceae bacterium]|nr:molecular chaperone DnaJ [Planctomycetaceae bacterium]